MRNRGAALALLALFALLALLGAAAMQGGFAARGPVAVADAHECRFWGLVGSGYPAALVREHLRDGPIASLRSLAPQNADGWGVAYWEPPSSPLPSLRPIVRRGGPRADDPGDPDFGIAVEEIAGRRPRAALAHVRSGTSGHLGIPDPHPFLMRMRNRDVAFAHNGGIAIRALEDMLADYLARHPLDYVRGLGETGPIGSELYGAFLCKFVEDHPEMDLAEGLVRAVGTLASDPAIVGDSPRLNFALSDGDTLYALHFYGDGRENPVRYYPARGADRAQDVAYWVVASQVLGATELGWGTIPPQTLAIFVPGRTPEFRPIPLSRRALHLFADLSARPVSAAPGEEHNCRLWALVGSGYPVSLIPEHLLTGSLRNLRQLGASNDDGWGLAFDPSPAVGLGLAQPIFRRGGPAAPRDEDFEHAVAEMREVAPVAAVGHVRLATSGHTGIPDPHPFHHRRSLFAHNGSLSVSALQDRLGETLMLAPPDYKPGFPGTGYVDSELGFLYLLKLIDARPDLPITEALLEATRTLAGDREVAGSSPRLNFVLTRGDTLYALHCYGNAAANPLSYYPVPGAGEARASQFWVVASEPLGSSAVGWGEMPARTLARFIPGEAPRWYPLDGPALSLAWAELEGTTDADGDGWYSTLRVRCDPNVSTDSACVSVEVWAREDESPWSRIGAARCRPIHGSAADTVAVDCSVDALDPALRATLRDVRVVLHAAGYDSAEASPETHPLWGLGDFPVEGSARDTISDAARACSFAWIDRVGEVDGDGDGHLSAFTLRWDTDLTPPSDSVRVYVQVLGAVGTRYFQLLRTEPYWIRGYEADTVSALVTVSPGDQEPEIWDLALRVFAAADDLPLASAWWRDHAPLDDVPVEGRFLDLTSWVGSVRPNPAGSREGGRLAIPLHIPEAGADVSADVLDSAGRVVWRSGTLRMDAGETTLEWRGCDLQGRILPSGAYFGRIRVGERIWTRRFVVVR